MTTLYRITSDGARYLSNVAQGPNGRGEQQYWIAYHEPVLGWKDLCVAYSADMQQWKKLKLKDVKIGKDPHAYVCPQVVGLGTALYVFWMDIDNKHLCATKYAPSDPSNPIAQYKWYTYVTLQTTRGVDIGEGPSGTTATFGATVSGNHILISLNYENRIETYLYNPELWGPGWKAGAQNTINLADWQAILPTLKSFGKNQAMTLFSHGGNRAYLLQVLEAVNTSGGVQWLSSIRQLESRHTSWGPAPRGTPSLAWFPEDVKAAPVYGLTTCLDPGGRVRATYRWKDGQVYTRTHASAYLDAGAWGPAERALTVQYRARDYPVAYFTLGAQTSDRTPQGKATQECAVTRWTVSGDDSKPDNDYAMSDDSGRVRKVERVEALNVTQQSTKPKVYAQGYIDGPAPVFTGMVNAATNTDYATTSSVSQSKEVVTNVTVGIKSEATGAPEIGVGPRWEASFNMTAGSGFGTEVAKSISMDTSFQLKSEGGKFRQTGLLRYADVVLCRDAYEYLPDGKTPVIDGPQCTSIYLDLSQNVKYEYTLGTVTVGDLQSYTKEAWNLRMQPLYPGKNYIDQVVIPNAVVFTSGQPTVADTWTPGSPLQSSFGSTAQVYASSSMTLDASLFVGVTTKFFGAEASFMAGFEVVNTTTETSVTNDGFGVSINIAGDPGGPVARYRVATYLLPSSKDWVRELLWFQKQDKQAPVIDAASACWKIMYVVNEILYTDPTSALDLPPARRAELEAKGIVTTQDLLRSLGFEYPSDLRRDVDADAPADPEAADLLAALRAWDAKRNYYAE